MFHPPKYTQIDAFWEVRLGGNALMHLNTFVTKLFKAFYTTEPHI
jgi:hypothetical protein